MALEDIRPGNSTHRLRSRQAVSKTAKLTAPGCHPKPTIGETSRVYSLTAATGRFGQQKANKGRKLVLTPDL